MQAIPGLEPADQIPAQFDEQLFERALGAFREASILLRSFVPRVFGGDLLLFRAALMAHHDDTLPSPRIWRPYIRGNIEVHDISCQHERMMRPAALMSIGPSLAAALERAGVPKSPTDDNGAPR
jgi:enterobactin synthetase component F